MRARAVPLFPVSAIYLSSITSSPRFGKRDFFFFKNFKNWFLPSGDHLRPHGIAPAVPLLPGGAVIETVGPQAGAVFLERKGVSPVRLDAVLHGEQQPGGELLKAAVRVRPDQTLLRQLLQGAPAGVQPKFGT